MPNIFCINPDSHDGIVYHSNKQQIGGSYQNFDDVNLNP